MSLYEFNAGVAGYAKAHGAHDETLITQDEAAALAARVDEKPVWH